MLRNKRLIWFLFLALFFNSKPFAQNILEVSVRTLNQKPLFSALVVLKGSVGVYSGMTDSLGICRMYVPSGFFHLNVQYLGYKEHSDSLLIKKKLQLKIKLKDKIIEGREVVIEGKQPDKNIRSTEIGVTTLQKKDIVSLPRMVGETDIIRALQYTPGVTLSGEGNSGLNIRGGASDQNLLLLDGAVIFNPAHLLGIFSAFNTDVVHQAKLYKSGIPASYGGRISSVLDIETTKGNFEKFEGLGTLGFIASKLFLTGPFIKEKLNFFISVRKSYLNEILYPLSRLLVKETNLVFNGLGYDYYDINAGINCRLNNRDFIQYRFYTGSDLLKLNQEDVMLKNRVNWSNLATSVQWNHLFNHNTSFAFMISHSMYGFDFFTQQDQTSFKFESNLQVSTAKINISKIFNSHSVKAGAEINLLNCLPNSSKANVDLFDLKYEAKNRYYSREYAVFINDEFELNEKWKFNAGYRQTFYHLIGPYKVVTYNDMNEASDSMDFSSGNTVVWYNHPDIRTSARYLLTKSLSLKASFSSGVQYLNQLTISSVSLPSDFWIPGTPKIKPQYAKQASLGVFKNFNNNKFETSLEAFYRTMEHQIEFNNSIFNTKQVRNFEDNLIFGKGKSFGFEVFVKKLSGKTNGWVSYTLSRSFRYFKEINAGRRFPAKYDRIHDFSAVLTHTLNKRWTFSAVFVYATGEAFTIPVARYMVNGNVLNEYGEYNGFRLPDYHRLDISATLMLKQKERTKSELNFSVYNVYNRQNPLYIFNEMRGNLDEYRLRVTPKQLSLLPVLPSVSWTYKF